MKTEVINIGVPADVFFDYSTSEIKELIIQAIEDHWLYYSRPIKEDEELPKYVTMPVRLPKPIAKLIRQLADEHALPINVYTCKLLDRGE